LGDVERLGKDLAREFHRRSFAGRHPLLTFVVAPLPALFVIWTAAWCVGVPLLFGVVMPLLGWHEGQTVAEMSTALLWTMLTCHYGLLLVPPTVAAIWFCRLALQSGRGFAWAAPACLLVAILAFTLVSDLRLPHESHQGRLLIGFGLPLPDNWRVPQIIGLWQAIRPEQQVFQTLCPLAVLVYAIWKTARARLACVPVIASNWTTQSE
jgi:hypothetical protein